MAQWVADDLPLMGAASTAPPSVNSAVSTSTTASSATKYMPPGARNRVLEARRNGKLFEAEADAAEHRLRLAEAEKSAQKIQHGKLPKFSLPFFLNKQQMGLLTSRFPRTEFGCASDNAHDHPLAHTETMIAVQKALRMAPAGSFLVDLYGSPKDMDAFVAKQARSNNPKRGLAFVGLKTEKDYLRSLKWGEPYANGRLRYREDDQGPVADLDVRADGLHDAGEDRIDGKDLVWFCKHTMYYLTDEQICELLRPAGSRMISIVHRHLKNSGELFGGECTYGKVGSTVEQVNTLTGERYVHRDLSYLWDSKSKVVRTDRGAYVWTFHMVSVDTWIIELTGCPVNMDERFASRSRSLGARGAAQELNEHDVAPSKFPHPSLAALPLAECHMVGSVPVISFTNGLLPDCSVTSPGLFEFLASNMVGKPRDTERLLDLFSLARSHVSNGQEFPGKRNFDVPHHEIAAHVILAFLSGLRNETELMRAVEGYRVWSREHVALMDGGALVATSAPQTMMATTVSAMKRVNTARKRGDTFDAILELVDHH